MTSGHLRRAPPSAGAFGTSRDAAAITLGNHVCEGADGYFLRRAYVVDPEMLAFVQDEQDTLNEVIDEDEGASLVSRSLYRKRDGVGEMVLQRLHARNELRDDMLVPHIGAVHIVGSDDRDAFELTTAVIDGHDLREDLARRV